MRHFIFTAAVFLLIAGTAVSQTARDTTLTMSDGVTLDALYVLPAGSPPASGFPAILLVHGFGGSKEDVRAQANLYAASGYAATGYSVRGQGNSGGEFDFFTSDRLRADLQAMINFTKALPRVNADRVAVLGASQGGIHAWSAAAYHMGARTVVSIIANGRFDEDWVENDAMNRTFALTISTTSTHLKRQLKDSVEAAIQSGDLGYVWNMLDQYSTAPIEDGVSTPVLMFSSYFDEFFNPSSALRQFARIPAPKRIVMYPAGHALPGDAPTITFASALADRWLTYWLKDNTADQTLLSPDSAVVLFDAASNVAHFFSAKDSALWLHPPMPLPSRLSRQTYSFAMDSLVPLAPALQGTEEFSYANLVGSTPLTFRTQPFGKDMTIAGAFGEASIFSQGTAEEYQINLLLFDYDPLTSAYLPVTRSHFEYKHNLSGTNNNSRMVLNAVCHTIKKGHVLEARVHGGIALIPNFTDNFGNLVMGPVQNSTNTILMGGAQPSQVSLYFLDAGTTATDELAAAPASPGLSVYPNPFTSKSTLRFTNAHSSVRIELFDNLGRSLGMLFDGSVDPGVHELSLHAEKLPAGMYHVVLTDAGRKQGIHLQLLK